MSCTSCTRKTLSLFIQSSVHAELLHIPRSSALPRVPLSRFSSAACRSQGSHGIPLVAPKPTARRQPTRDTPARSTIVERKEKEPWQVHKAAIQEKLGGEAWNPRKKLSPDTMEGIRHLHQTRPQHFTTGVLAQHFKVSPEAVRRILKSKWRPSDEEHEERLRRWDKRGERIWSNLVELGVKPPKRWREMGVGRASPGQKPRWKSRSRNTVPVHDSSPNDGFSDGIIPIVDGRSGEALHARWQRTTFLSERML